MAIQKIVSRLPDSYLLNVSQIFHMLLLAAFIPWYIGLSEYGKFYAIFAIPGIVQSTFETWCISTISRARVRTSPVPLIVGACLAALFLVIINTYLERIPSYMVFSGIFLAAVLCFRTYGYAIAISLNAGVRDAVISELMIFGSYLIVCLVGISFEIRGATLPFLMVTTACLTSGIYLLYMRQPLKKEGVINSDLAFNAAAERKRGFSALFGRLYEDGVITLSPLVLAAIVNPVVAGQFRVFSSVVKLLYKLFPYRYEIVIRDMFRGVLNVSKLLRISALFSALPIVIFPVALLLIKDEVDLSLLIFISMAGCVASMISLYPAASLVNGKLHYGCAALIFFTILLSYIYGEIGFSVGFLATNLIVCSGVLITMHRAC